MLTDYWAHKFLQDPKAAEEIEDEDFDLQSELAKLEENPDSWETLSKHGHQDSNRG